MKLYKVNIRHFAFECPYYYKFFVLANDEDEMRKLVCNHPAFNMYSPGEITDFEVIDVNDGEPRIIG